MTYKAVVSYCRFYSGELTSEIVEVEEKSPKAAVLAFESIRDSGEAKSEILKWAQDMPDDLEGITEEYAARDAIIEVIWGV